MRPLARHLNAVLTDEEALRHENRELHAQVAALQSEISLLRRALEQPEALQAVVDGPDGAAEGRAMTIADDFDIDDGPWFLCHIHPERGPRGWGIVIPNGPAVACSSRAEAEALADLLNGGRKP